jgi:phosphoribosylamine---glycine ligase
MGSICPVPSVDSTLLARIERDTVAPTFAGMKREGIGYRGVLYFGLMITGDGPKVLEYNARFGDPETQVLLPCMEEDMGDLLDAMIHGTLPAAVSGEATAAALGIVVAARGYPDSYGKNAPVDPIPDLPEKEALIFHASTIVSPDGRVLTSGGRCFTVVGRGRDLAEASRRAYDAVGAVRFPGAWHRGDIGAKHLGGPR